MTNTGTHPETNDLLSRRLRLIQHRDGHRAAADDVLLAWAAWRAHPQAGRILELGCGKGTVGLLLLSRMPYSLVLGVEAHAPHYALACRNAVLNGMELRFYPRHGDLRDGGLLAGEPPFDLACGAPPFLPVGSGVQPKDTGRAAGRFELRGGVEDYAAAAARHLSAEGLLVLLMDGQAESRPLQAIRTAGLFPRRILDVLPHPGKDAKYRIYEASRAAGEVRRETLALRPSRESAGWTEEYSRIRSALDLP